MLLTEWQHVAREVWFYDDQDNSKFKVLDKSGEDPNGSNSNGANLEVNDHLAYLGVTNRNGGC
jgi:hypothetical protein